MFPIASPTGFGHAPDLSSASSPTHVTARIVADTTATTRTLRNIAFVTNSRYWCDGGVSLFPAFDVVAVAG